MRILFFYLFIVLNSWSLLYASNSEYDEGGEKKKFPSRLLKSKSLPPVSAAIKARLLLERGSKPPLLESSAPTTRKYRRNPPITVILPITPPITIPTKCPLTKSFSCFSILEEPSLSYTGYESLEGFVENYKNKNWLSDFLDLSNKGCYTGLGLAPLKELPHLKSLNLSGNPLTPQDIYFIKVTLPYLDELILDPETHKALLNQDPNLAQLTFWQQAVKIKNSHLL